MQLPNTNFWMIRAGQDGHVLHRFRNQGIAYLGWGETGHIHPETSEADLRYLVEKANPAVPLREAGHITRMIWGFCCEIAVGDAVVTYEPQRRLYHIGIVKSDAEYKTVIWGPWRDWDEFEQPGYVRQIDWVSTISRDSLSQTARNSLGRPPTHFQLPAAVSAEIRRLCA